jgi:adenylate kinase
MTTIIITGTPGTGKTSVSKIVSEKLESELISVNELVDQKHIYTGINKEKEYKEVDLNHLSREIQSVIQNSPKNVIVEGHLAHYIEKDEFVDLVIVLRARPDILRKRLNKRAWSDSKVQENLEAEALDICTFEAVTNFGEKVNEIDTSDISMVEVADQILKVLNGEKHFPPGEINFLDDLYK